VINKKGQTQISFGMIFSIILIVLFIAFAIYGITKFLEVQRYAQIEKFKSDLQGDINKMWGSTYSTGQELEYTIPKKIKQVCFTSRDEFENMYFVPLDSGYKGYTLDNIDITQTVRSLTTGKLCIDSTEGKISMTIKKAYNEILVTITK
jgi:hypothetical protein